MALTSESVARQVRQARVVERKMCLSSVRSADHQALEQVEGRLIGVRDRIGWTRRWRLVSNQELGSPRAGDSGEKDCRKGASRSQGVRAQVGARAAFLVVGEENEMAIAVWSKPVAGRVLWHGWTEESRALLTKARSMTLGLSLHGEKGVYDPGVFRQE